MTLKSSIAEEVKRTPLAAISGVLSAFVALLSLALAWVQFRTGSSTLSASASVEAQQAGELFLGNLLLVVAYFLAATTAVALLLRIFGRKHKTASFFASIPLVSLTNFSTVLVLYLAPPRKLSVQLFASAHDLIFYASAAIVIAFCGSAVLRNIAIFDHEKREPSKAEGEEEGGTVGGFLFLAAILLIGWSWLVFAGQVRLAKTLLPEIAHPVEGKSVDATPNPSIESTSPGEPGAASHIKRQPPTIERNQP